MRWVLVGVAMLAWSALAVALVTDGQRPASVAERLGAALAGAGTEVAVEGRALALTGGPAPVACERAPVEALRCELADQAGVPSGRRGPPEPAWRSSRGVPFELRATDGRTYVVDAPEVALEAGGLDGRWRTETRPVGGVPHTFEAWWLEPGDAAVVVGAPSERGGRLGFHDAALVRGGPLADWRASAAPPAASPIPPIALGVGAAATLGALAAWVLHARRAPRAVSRPATGASRGSRPRA